MFSQTPPNQQNSLNASGYVGVGTTNPDSKLQVNGNMSVDSSLTVRDTAVFEKQARMKDKIIVEGDAVIKGKLTAKDNFKVLGTAKMEGNVKMTALPNANANDTSLLFINANGKITSGGIPALIDILSANPQTKDELTKLIYSEACILVPSGPPGQNSLTGITPQEYIPVWANKVGVLWTGLPCPAQVGIGTENPLATLDVRGSAYFTTHTGIGIAPELHTTLSVRSYNMGGANSDIIGLQVELTNPDINPDHYGIKTIVQNDGTKALAVVNRTLGVDKDVFRVYGDGKIWATGINIKNQTLFPDYVFDEGYNLMTFSQLRAYIQINGHLPNMPTAKQVEKEGLELDKLVVKQQEKIEELTLYVLELESRLSKLEQDKH